MPTFLSDFAGGGGMGGELAKRLQVADSKNPARLVHRWIKGNSFPSQKNLAIIFKATNGKVTPNDFLTQ